MDEKTTAYDKIWWGGLFNGLIIGAAGGVIFTLAVLDKVLKE